MQHLVDYVVASSHDDRRPSARVVRQLSFMFVPFSEEGFLVLLLAIEHNTMPVLTKIKVHSGSLVGAASVSRLVQAFCNSAASSTLTDLDICCQNETVLDISLLARLLVVRPRMERLSLGGSIAWQELDNPEARRALQHALVGNNDDEPHLKELCLLSHVPSALAVVIFQALRINTTLESLKFGEIVKIGSEGDDDLRHIMTSIAAMKGLRQLTLSDSPTRLPWQVLLENGLLLHAIYKNTSLIKMGELEETKRYMPQYALDITKINMMCHVNALLAPQPRPTGNDVLIGPPTLIRPKSGIWSKAIAHLGRRDGNTNTTTCTTTTTTTTTRIGMTTVVTTQTTTTTLQYHYPGASAIFMILQRRPTIVGKQVRRPVAAAVAGDEAAAAAAPAGLHHEDEPPRQRIRLF
jgi:hypothetical protein